MTVLPVIPDGVPQLSPGTHRSAKTGACFMEFASYLAGEPWSDSPQCTDPLLAHLARAVNDRLSDERRGEIVPDIPRVIGLRGDHRVIAPVVAVRAAASALPVVSMGRQHALAVALLTLPRLLPADAAPAVRHAAREALDAVPEAARWATDHLRRNPVKDRDLRRGAAAMAVQLAATGIAEACVEDPDALLIAALRAAITDVEDLLTSPAAIVDGCLERTSLESKPRSASRSSRSSRMTSTSI
ncbi:hypothetical protein [Pseudolysinimonas sp.]|jgi:hypothetical protein|uniref:hypothetical protein n=1 Tax=Pseudolysinimonas sp. TaxID=2680009 RepID=UPI0037841CC1